MSTAEQKPTIELLETGDVVRHKRGGKVEKLATFEDGHLEFVSEEANRDFREQIVRVIQEDEEGITGTGEIVKSFGIAGRPKDEPTGKIPPCPVSKLGLGDKDPKVVAWYFKYKPQEAYVRYRVHLDKDGEPVRAHVRRKIYTFGVDPDTNSNEQIESIDESFDGIIADRASTMTYLPTDIVRGGGEE